LKLVAVLKEAHYVVPEMRKETHLFSKMGFPVELFSPD
jgi:hypothetical protein